MVEWVNQLNDWMTDCDEGLMTDRIETMNSCWSVFGNKSSTFLFLSFTFHLSERVIILFGKAWSLCLLLFINISFTWNVLSRCDPSVQVLDLTTLHVHHCFHITISNHQFLISYFHFEFYLSFFSVNTLNPAYRSFLVEKTLNTKMSFPSVSYVGSCIFHPLREKLLSISVTAIVLSLTFHRQSLAAATLNN